MIHQSLHRPEFRRKLMGPSERSTPITLGLSTSGGKVDRTTNFGSSGLLRSGAVISAPRCPLTRPDEHRK